MKTDTEITSFAELFDAYAADDVISVIRNENSSIIAAVMLSVPFHIQKKILDNLPSSVSQDVVFERLQIQKAPPSEILNLLLTTFIEEIEKKVEKATVVPTDPIVKEYTMTRIIRMLQTSYIDPKQFSKLSPYQKVIIYQYVSVPKHRNPINLSGWKHYALLFLSKIVSYRLSDMIEVEMILKRYFEEKNGKQGSY